jgi:hypothetical protein
LYFLSDAPHLLKTTRNAWYNKSRKLWVYIQLISCLTIIILYLFVLYSVLVKKFHGLT